jgi:Flp pilus assembly protein TadD
MARILHILNLVLWSTLAALPAQAQQQNLDDLYNALKSPGLADYKAVEAKIQEEWSKSGSDAMDLLLIRGEDALQSGDTATAIEHLTALTDHAPNFAEGWNALATAYFHAGLYGPAIDALQRALVLNPRNFEALSGLGIILRDVGEKKQALAAFRKAHELTPHREDLVKAIRELSTEVEGVAL